MIAAGKHVVWTPDLGREWHLWCLGDIHWGAKGCDEPLCDRTLEKIRRDPRALWIGMGDYFDLISWHDRRFDPEMIAEKSRSAYFKGLGASMVAEGIRKFRPIRKKCLGLLTGNHEWRYGRDYDQAVVSDLARALDTRFLGYCCFLDLVFKTHKSKRQTFRIWAHHGAGFAKTPGGKYNRLRRFTQGFVAHIYIIGHVHMKLDDELVRLAADARCRHITHESQTALISGTYLRTYHQDDSGASGYGERAGYEPVPLGSPCIIIEPETRALAVRK